MKKICMITQDAPYIDRRILLQAKTLIENGYQVSIVYPFGEINKDFENIGIRYIAVNPKISVKNSLSKIKRLIRKVIPQNLYTNLKKIYFYFSDPSFIDFEEELKELAIIDDYDIYVAHDLPALPIAVEASKIKSAKLVYDAHEFFTGQIALQGKRKKFFESLERKLIYDVDLMFTVNEDIANLFKKSYGLNNIKILYNSIEKRAISQINLHKKLNINENKKIVLYQGGFLEDRNLEKLVKSAKYLADNIVLVMLGYSFLEEKLKNIANCDKILNKKIYFLDRVPQKDLLNYTAGADFGVIPYPAVDLNTKYCTPNKMFEFLMAGIPIIANDELITVSNIFNKYNIGNLISFEDEKIIAKGINQVVNSTNFSSIKSGIEKVKDAFSWENQEKILITSCKNLNI
jgi:glycosyltransferase involved in cell wall biosynthesis